MKRTLFFAFALLACLPLARVHASGFAAPAVGPSNSGVTSEGPVSMHYNPAGIGFAKRLRLIAGGSLMVGDLRYQRERRATYQYEDSLDFALPIDPTQIDYSKTGVDNTVSASPLGFAPALFGEAPLGKLPLVLGFGVYVPYAAQVEWPKDGPQRFQLIEATLAHVYITAGLAVAFKKVSIGLAGSLIVGYANLSKIQDLAGVPLMGEALARPPINQGNDFGADADPAVRELDTLARPFALKGAMGLSGTVKPGILAEVAENFWVGASYELFAPLTMVGDFTLDMNDPFFTQDLASQGLAYKPLVKGTGQLRYVLPDVARIGIRYAFGKKYNDTPSTSLALEGSYTRWSTVRNFKVEVDSPDLRQTNPSCEPASAKECELIPRDMKFYLPRRWHDTFGAALRANHRATEKLALWATLGYETGASPDATIDAASPDGERITVGGGLSHAIGDAFAISLDLVVQHMMERKVLASDYDLANGTYRMRLIAMSAYASYAF